MLKVARSLGTHTYSTICAIIIRPPPKNQEEGKRRREKERSQVKGYGNVIEPAPGAHQSKSPPSHMAASQLEPPRPRFCKFPFPDATDRGIVPSGRGAFLPVNMQISLGGEASRYESTVHKSERKKSTGYKFGSTKPKSDLCGRQRRTLVFPKVSRWRCRWRGLLWIMRKVEDGVALGTGFACCRWHD